MVLGFMVMGLNLLPAQPAKEKDYSWLFRAYPASAQGIIICGVCCSGDTACWERRRRDFENANPPRGELTGVCYASRYRYEPDPVTRQNVQKWSTPIFTRVRFNETEVLAEDHHGRNAGFEVSVGAAWREFILTQAPQSDGWNWTSSCISLTSPRGKEAEYWAKAQEQMAYQRVFMPTYGIADTPEERALEAKLTAERKAKEAEAARQAEIKRKETEARAAEAERKRLAAEAARKAELARIEAERQKKVDAIAEQLGPGKRQAAEKLQKMNDELAALRPKPKVTPPPRQCKSRSFSTPVSNTASTEAAARKGLSAYCNIGGSETVTSKSMGAMTCSQRQGLYLKPPPVGKCLSCISEQMAINMFGYVPGKGYPPPPVEWVCKATTQCVAETCGTGPSRVRQE
jgi:hypothetical protein